MAESASASFRSSGSSPGIPKTGSTPSASRHPTRSWAAVRGMDSQAYGLVALASPATLVAWPPAPTLIRFKSPPRGVRRLRGLSAHRWHVGSPPCLPHLRPRRLLRLLSEPACLEACRRDRAPDRKLTKALRGLVLVLRRRGRGRRRVHIPSRHE